ncbi:MAG TPA: ABC transporter substrate-binding protein [Gammaproteobacteria bacterium]
MPTYPKTAGGRPAWAAALLLMWLTALAQDAPAPGATPEDTVRTLHDALVETAAELGDASLEERYARLEPVVEATHDLPYIAELTIRREWDGLSVDDRQRFVEAFERLSVTTYASRFRRLEAGMFEITGGESLAGGRAQVAATLTTKERAIPFQYVLHETDAGWKIVNILADNVSDLALKRAEYRRLLEGGSVDDVIAELERQTAEAAAAD